MPADVLPVLLDEPILRTGGGHENLVASLAPRQSSAVKVPNAGTAITALKAVIGSGTHHHQNLVAFLIGLCESIAVMDCDRMGFHDFAKRQNLSRILPE